MENECLCVVCQIEVVCNTQDKDREERSCSRGMTIIMGIASFFQAAVWRWSASIVCYERNEDSSRSPTRESISFYYSIESEEKPNLFVDAAAILFLSMIEIKKEREAEICPRRIQIVPKMPFLSGSFMCAGVEEVKMWIHTESLRRYHSITSH